MLHPNLEFLLLSRKETTEKKSTSVQECASTLYPALDSKTRSVEAPVPFAKALLSILPTLPLIDILAKRERLDDAVHNVE